MTRDVKRVEIMRMATAARRGPVPDRRDRNDITGKHGSLARTAAALALLAACWTSPARGQEVPEAWKAMDPPALAAEYLRLKTWGAMKEAQRRQLSQYAGERFESARAAGKVNIRPWLNVVIVMGWEIPETPRMAMLGMIQRELAPDAGAISTLSVEELLQVRRAVMAVTATRKADSDIVIAWVTASDKYKSADGASLWLMLESLRWGDAPRFPAQKRVGEQLEAAYLSGDPAATRSVTMEQWAGFAKEMGWFIGKERSARWADKLYAAYVSDAGALAGLSYGDAVSLEWVLSQLGQSRQVVVPWVEAGKNWQGANMPELCAIARNTVAAGQAGAAATGQLIKHISGKYAGDSEAVRSAGLTRWAELVGVLGKNLPPETAKAWEARLWEAYVADTAALGQLSEPDRGTLEGLLGQLGSTRSSGVAVEWVTRTEAGKAADLPLLTGLAGRLAGMGQPGQAALAKLTGYAQARYIDDPAAARSIGLPGVRSLAGAFATSMPAGGDWAGKIYSAYVGDVTTLASLKAEDCQPLEDLLKQMGMTTAPNVYMAWVEKTDAWKAADLLTLTAMVTKLGESPEAGKAAQGRVIAHIEAAYLADADKTQTIRCPQWSQTVGALRQVLGEKSRALWAARLRAAYVQAPGALGALKSSDAYILSRTLESLGDDTSKAVLAQWLARKNSP